MTAHLCDVNVWLALSIEQHGMHESAAAWMASLEQPESMVFCRSTQQSYLRLMTTSALVARYGYTPFSNREAWGAYEALLRDERVSFQPNEPAGLQTLWKGFTTSSRPSPKTWMDAYLAAFAVAAGLTLATGDAAFRQFRGLDLLLLAASANDRDASRP